MQSVFQFLPIFKERPWGGRAIARVGTSHSLPENKLIGESWEIVDRPEDESLIAHGEFRGRPLRWLLREHGAFVMGRPWPADRRFPLLVKILDARDRLSLQVHPTAPAADRFGGEPKTEMWYLLDAEPQAFVLAGLRPGVTRHAFEAALKKGAVEPLIHRIPVRKGDAMFIPSGRVHAIGEGCLILEIQQNSDTTYRVFDWGRSGPDGRPRELHVPQSLESIHFNDFEPGIARPIALGTVNEASSSELLVSCENFSVIRYRISLELKDTSFFGGAQIIHVLQGNLEIEGHDQVTRVETGQTVLLAACRHSLHPVDGPAEFIHSIWNP